MSSNPQPLNFSNALRTIRFQAKNVGDLLVLREGNPLFQEAIDGEHVLDLWAKFLTLDYINRAFEGNDVYMVERILKTYKYIVRVGIKSELDDYFSSPDGLVVNKDREIDDLIVSYDYINSTAEVHGKPHTPLSWACFTGNYRRATFLLNHGADPNMSEEFFYLIQKASEVDNGELKNPTFLRLVDLFIAKGVDNIHIVDGLYEATDDYDFVKYIIEKAKPDLNDIPASQEEALLSNVIRTAPFNVIKLLLDNGADPNTESDGTSALVELMRTEGFRLDIIALLCDYGVVFDPKDDDGEPVFPDNVFNLADFLDRIGYTKTKGKPSDILKVVKTVLEQDKDHIHDKLEGMNIFMVVSNLETLKFLVSKLEGDDIKMLAETLPNSCNVLSYMYASERLDCIQFLLSLKLNFDLGISKMFENVDRDDPKYARTQADVDALIQPFVPPGSLSGFIPVAKFIEYFNDKTLSDDKLSYILQTVNSVDFANLFKTAEPHMRIPSSRKEAIQLILTKRHQK